MAIAIAACNPANDPDFACPLRAQPEDLPGPGASTRLSPALSLVSVSHERKDAPPIAHSLQDKVIRLSAPEKICQLTGETDRELAMPTLNQTETRAGIVGTDLGFSFEHHGKLFFLFGDTISVDRIERGSNEDSIAYATGTAEDGCIPLTFNLQSDGGFRPPKIPGVSNHAFEVPAGGVSANGKMYVYFTTDSTPGKLMGRSVVGVSVDDGRSFSKVYDLSNDKFINIDPVKVDSLDLPELPAPTSKQSVLLFGNAYARGNPFLAVVPEAGIEDKDQLRFFAGIDPASGKPAWSERESDSRPIVEGTCSNEFSIAWNPFLGKWILLYNCWRPNGLNMRTADKPWGPWSEEQVVFAPSADKGLCHFMHQGWRKVSCDALESQFVAGRVGDLCLDARSVCDCVSDSGSQSEQAGEYGPYMIPSMFTADETGSTIYFTLSLHNPYNTILMKARLGFGVQPGPQ